METKEVKGTKHKTRYALTLGEQAEIRVGSTLTGKGLAPHGFSVQELKELAEQFGNCDFRILSDSLEEPRRRGNEAAVLLIKGGIDRLAGKGTADAMLKEQDAIAYDTKYFDCRRQRTVNNLARLNVVFGTEGAAHTEDYQRGTIVAWKDVPQFARLRQMLPKFLGDKAIDLNGEGNHYHHDKAHINFHGDSERKIVVGISLGRTMTLRYCWRAPNSSKCHKGPFDFTIEHGDIYVMSEKASGWDWRCRSKYRLVHAAGAAAYLKHD